jgi:hypothetical protein
VTKTVMEQMNEETGGTVNAQIEKLQADVKALKSLSKSFVDEKYVYT